MKKYFGYHKTENLPSIRGKKVTIPKGTRYHSMKDGEYHVTGRKMTVTVNHLSSGQEVPDYDWERYYKDSHPNPVKSLNHSNYYVLSNPGVVWPGSGGYWHTADLNDVEDL